MARLLHFEKVLRNGRRPSFRVRLDIERTLVRCLELKDRRTSGVSNTINDGDRIEARRGIALLRELASFDPYVVAGDATADFAPRPIPAVAELHRIVLKLADVELNPEKLFP